MRILIACPIKDREWILPDYLEHILALDYDKSKISLYFVINNCIDNSLKHIKNFCIKHSHLYERIYVDNHTDKEMPDDKRTKEVRRNYTYHLLAALRNRMLDKCVEIGADYLLSCDSDILVRPDTLKRLLEHKEHCVSSLVYNGYLYQSIDEAYKFSNCLRFNANKGIYEHVVSKRIAEPNSNPVGTTTVVDFTGACILISRELASKARYAYFNRGEDEPFCKSAKKLGYNVLCDISMLQAHIMSPHILLLYRKCQLPHLTYKEV